MFVNGIVPVCTIGCQHIVCGDDFFGGMVALYIVACLCGTVKEGDGVCEVDICKERMGFKCIGYNNLIPSGSSCRRIGGRRPVP